MVGRIADLDRIAGLAWRQPGRPLLLLGLPLDTPAGDDRLGLAGSSWLQVCQGLCTGRPPRTDLNLERRVQGALRAAIAAGLVEAAHDISDGGLLVALAEMALASAAGASIRLPSVSVPLQRLLFAEGGARVVVAAAAADAAPLQALLIDHDCPAELLGSSSDDGQLRLQLGSEAPLGWEVEELRRLYEGALPRRLGGTPGGAE